MMDAPDRDQFFSQRHQLARALLQSLDVAQVAQTAVDATCALAGFDACGIAVIDDRHGWLLPVNSTGASEPIVRRLVAYKRAGARLLREMARLGRPIAIDDVRADARLSARLRQGLGDAGLRVMVLLPMVDRQRAVGLLIGARCQPTPIDAPTLDMLRLILEWVAPALANAQRYHREQRAAAQRHILVDTLRLALGSMQLEALLPQLAENANRLLEADGAFITRWDERTRSTIPMAAHQALHAAYASEGPYLGERPTLTQAVLEASRPLAVYDFVSSPYARPKFADRFPKRSMLALPLIARDRRWGALLIASDTPRRFLPDEIGSAQTIADLIALAIGNTDLLASEARLRRQAETLQRVTTSLTSSLELDAVLDNILDQLGHVVECHSASIQLVRGGQLEIVAGRGLPDVEAARRTAEHIDFSVKAREMLRSRSAVVIGDTHTHPHWTGIPGLEHIRSWIGAPLIERDHLIGILNVDHRQPNAYDEQTAALVTHFAHQAAIAITNARLYQEERERVAHLGALTDIVSIASSTLDVQVVSQALADNLVRVIGGDECRITRWVEDEQRPVPMSAYGPARELYASVQLPAGAGASLTSRVLESGQPLTVEDIFETSHRDVAMAAHFVAHSWLVLPLIADGRKLGAALIGFIERHRFTEEEVARASRAAELVAVAVAKARLHEDLRQHALRLEAEVAARTQELRAAHEQLRSVDRLKSRLITHIGHEFRTPVANLVMYLHLLASGRIEKRDQYLQVLTEQTEALTRLIESVTAFATVDLAPEARPAYPWPLAREVEPAVARWQSDASARSIRLELAAPGADVEVRANPQRVAAALDELLSNAIAYTDAGGSVVVRVTQETREDRTWACASVFDTGVGIPPEELPRVFDQFFRGRQRALQVRGVGLGLSLVHAIAASEGGRITAESEGVGKGSTFRLWLPVVE